MNLPDTETGTDRNYLTQLLILAALGVALGRLASAERVYEPSNHVKRSVNSGPVSRWPETPPKPMPTFGSNDRSRWATVRALVEEGTFVIGHRTSDGESGHKDSGIIFEDGWQSVDKVLHPETLEFYSSKPPLLSTLMAGLYWPVYHVLGLSLAEEPFLVVRPLVGLINVLPLVFYLWLLYQIAVRYSTQSWTPLFLVTAGAFGTLLSPFLITFSNHVPAVYGTLFLLAIVLRIERLGASAGLGWYMLAGLIAGFNVTNELPTLSFTVLCLALLARISLRGALLGYVPMALVPIATLFALNYLALGQLALAYSTTDSAWYQYAGSHWLQVPGVTRRGIDFASNTEGKLEYSFHLLLGHHGFFSLTPIYLLGLVALVMGLGGRKQTNDSVTPPTTLPWWYAPAVLLISIVVIGFYIYRSNNYGGWCNGPRWLLWLSPLWLVGMIPIVDRLATSRWGRSLAMVLLLFSILSASHFDWNPWRHPWIYIAMDSAGAIPY